MSPHLTPPNFLPLVCIKFSILNFLMHSLTACITLLSIPQCLKRTFCSATVSKLNTLIALKWTATVRGTGYESSRLARSNWDYKAAFDCQLVNTVLIIFRCQDKGKRQPPLSLSHGSLHESHNSIKIQSARLTGALICGHPWSRRWGKIIDHMGYHSSTVNKHWRPCG